MNKVNWGIIGPGWIAHKFADAISKVPNAQLIACASKDINKANDFKAKYNLLYAYNNYEQLVNNEEIDAVYIATTHNFHHKNAMLCLNNNKHILVEKPFTINAKEAKEIAVLAKEKNLFVMEAMWTRFLPVNRWVCEQIKNGKIGKVYNLSANFGFPMEFSMESRMFNPNLAGGGLLDLGIYPLSYAVMVLGHKPVKITSVVKMGQTGVDEQATVSLLYENGVMADISYSILCHYNNESNIYGSLGRIVIPNFYDPKYAKLIDSNGEINEFTVEDKNGFIFEIEEATNLILKGEKQSPVLPVEETVEIMKICDELRNSWNFKYPNET